MNQDQLKEFIVKLTHDLACHRRNFDLVSILLHEGASNLENAKKLLTETIVDFDLTQKGISGVHVGSLEETKKPEKGIS